MKKLVIALLLIIPTHASASWVSLVCDTDSKQYSYEIQFDTASRQGYIFSTYVSTGKRGVMRLTVEFENYENVKLYHTNYNGDGRTYDGNLNRSNLKYDLSGYGGQCVQSSSVKKEDYSETKPGSHF